MLLQVCVSVKLICLSSVQNQNSVHDSPKPNQSTNKMLTLGECKQGPENIHKFSQLRNNQECISDQEI
jgi:hypothetical protein